MSAADRNYPPPPSRLREARARGEAAKSPRLTAAIVLGAGVAAIAAFGPRFAVAAAAAFESSIAAMSDPSGAAPGELVAAASRVAGAAAPLVLVPFAAAAAASLAQTGPMLATAGVAPSLSALNPLPRLRAMFGPGAALSLVGSLVLVGLVAASLWAVARPSLADLADLTASGPPRIAGAAWRLSLSLAGWIVAGALGLGLLDLLHARWRHRRALRVSRDEWLRALREDEGDPALKAAVRRTHRQLAAAPEGAP